eukprot:s382_g8.t1
MENSYHHAIPTIYVVSPDVSWCLAFGICFLPLSLAAMRKSSLIKEDWPWTPFALFPWSGPQWNFLHAAFVDGDTRLVAPSIETIPNPASLVGEVLVLYDLWSRTLGITTYQDEVMFYLKSALSEHNESEELASPLLTGAEKISGRKGRKGSLGLLKTNMPGISRDPITTHSW